MLSKEAGKPIQKPYTRLEPAGIQELNILSDAQRNKWQAAVEVGQEIRRDRVGGALNTGQHILCIDFGTSKSVAAIADEDGVIQVIRDAAERQFVPSSVRFLESMDYVVGEASGSFKEVNVEHAISAVKRTLASNKRYNIRGRSLTPEFVASLIIRSIKRDAELATGRIFSQVLMAAPANFNIAQQNALYQAFGMAGLHIYRMFSEQNAVAMNLYSRLSEADRSRDFFVLMIDLGGGTLDIGMAEYSYQEGWGLFESKYPIGENKVGGIDFDEAIVGVLRREISCIIGRPESSFTDRESAMIMEEAERSKIALTASELVAVVISDIEDSNGEIVNIAFEFGRNQFRHATQFLLQRVEECIDYSLKLFEQWDGGQISYVVLAGSGSKIFAVEELVRRRFSSSRIFTEFRDQAVVRGLAAYSLVLTGDSRSLLLLDNIAWSLGIRCVSVDTEPKLATISGRADENRMIEDMIDVGEIVPRKKGLKIKFVNMVGDRIQVEICTTSAWGTDTYGCGSILVKGRAVAETLELMVETDFNGVVVITVQSKAVDNQYRPSSFQVNRKFQLPIGYVREGESETDDFESETLLRVFPN